MGGLHTHCKQPFSEISSLQYLRLILIPITTLLVGQAQYVVITNWMLGCTIYSELCGKVGALPVVTRLTVDLQNVTNVMNAIRKKFYTMQKFANINTIKQRGYMLRGHSHLMSPTKGRG